MHCVHDSLGRIARRERHALGWNEARVISPRATTGNLLIWRRVHHRLRRLEMIKILPWMFLSLYGIDRSRAGLFKHSHVEGLSAALSIVGSLKINPGDRLVRTWGQPIQTPPRCRRDSNKHSFIA